MYPGFQPGLAVLTNLYLQFVVHADDWTRLHICTLTALFNLRCVVGDHMMLAACSTNCIVFFRHWPHSLSSASLQLDLTHLQSPFINYNGLHCFQAGIVHHVVVNEDSFQEALALCTISDKNVLL
jgi:hypothetical protein